MAVFMVDVTQTSTRTYRVEVDNGNEAEERYPDVGLVVNSETGPEEVVKVTRVRAD